MDAAKLAAAARAHGAELIIQFGSTVTGRAIDTSDIDLGVVMGRHPSLDEELALAAALQPAFADREPHREIDLVVLDRADPLLLHRVAAEGVLLFGQTARFHEWKMYAYRRFQDHRPYLEMERDYIRRELAARQP